MKRERRVEEKFCDEKKSKDNKLEECKTFLFNVTVSVCNLPSSPCPFSTSAFWDVSRSYITTSPLLNDATMWAGSQPLKSTDVGTPCSTNTNTRQLDRLQFQLWPVGGWHSPHLPLFVLKVLMQGFFSVGFHSLTVPSAEQDRRRFLMPL